MKETKPLNNGEKKVLRNEKGQIEKGSAPLNPAGKPLGSKHLSTLLWNALLERAKKEDGTLSEKTYAELVIQRLLNDNIKYGKRTELIFDRIEGQAKQEIDFTSGGETMNSSSIDVIEIARRVSQELKKKKTN